MESESGDPMEGVVSTTKTRTKARARPKPKPKLKPKPMTKTRARAKTKTKAEKEKEKEKEKEEEEGEGEGEEEQKEGEEQQGKETKMASDSMEVEGETPFTAKAYDQRVQVTWEHWNDRIYLLVDPKWKTVDDLLAAAREAHQLSPSAHLYLSQSVESCAPLSSLEDLVDDQVISIRYVRAATVLRDDSPTPTPRPSKRVRKNKPKPLRIDESTLVPIVPSIKKAPPEVSISLDSNSEDEIYDGVLPPIPVPVSPPSTTLSKAKSKVSQTAVRNSSSSTSTTALSLAASSPSTPNVKGRKNLRDRVKAKVSATPPSKGRTPKRSKPTPFSESDISLFSAQQLRSAITSSAISIPSEASVAELRIYHYFGSRSFSAAKVASFLYMAITGKSNLTVQQINKGCKTRHLIWKTYSTANLKVTLHKEVTAFEKGKGFFTVNNGQFSLSTEAINAVDAARDRMPQYVKVLQAGAMKDHISEIGDPFT